MLLNSVVFILQETLEAALLVSISLAISFLLKIGSRWLAYAIGPGIIGACIYAFNMKVISGWFDYVGQEVVNASLQIIIMLLISAYAAIVFRLRKNGRKNTETNHYHLFYSLIAGSIVSLGITREGSEILLYLSGFYQQVDLRSAVAIGSSIGVGLGLSLGVILYYALVNLPVSWRLKIPVMLLAVFAGNMASQAALYLTQADWLLYTPVLWNTSALISESSVIGRLLYALFGYEATPSLAQLFSYLSGITLVGLVAYANRRLAKNGALPIDK